MPLGKRDLQNSKDIKALSKKILPATLLERIYSRITSRNTKFKSVQRCEHSWKEHVRGACGLFDISGFSRLAAKLSNDEKLHSYPTGEKKTDDTMNVAALAVPAINKNKKDDKAGDLRRRSRRESTIKALDEEIIHYSPDMLDGKTNDRESNLNRGLFRHADKVLGEELGRQGQGAEFLASFISDFFETLVNKIHSFGGDIIKIAGDCLICFWEYRETKDSGNLRSCNGMAELVYDAVRCGFQLKDCVTQLKDTSTLSVHICIGAGNMELVSLSSHGRSEFFLLGDAYIEALTGIDASNSGEIVISKGAYAYLHGVDDLETNLTEDPLEGIKTEIGKTNDESKPSNLIKLYGVQAREIEGHDERLLLALNCDALPMPLARLVPAELSSKCDEDTLICKETNQYFPKNLQQQIEIGLEGGGSLRNITVMFVNFIGIENMDLDTLSQLFRSIMSCVRLYEASLKEFVVDDKGAVAVIVFGFPGSSHNNTDHAANAIALGLDLRMKATAIGIQLAIGIATGLGYCGMVGGKDRWNYGAVGSIVNLSARFMGVDIKEGGCIVVCENTKNFRSVREFYRFRALQPLNLKGYEGKLVNAFVPVGKMEIQNIFNPDRSLFVGREGILQDLSNACLQKDGLIVLNALEAGIGSTAVLSELTQLMIDKNVLICLATSRRKGNGVQSSFSCISSAFEMLIDEDHMYNHYHEISKDGVAVSQDAIGMERISRNRFQSSKLALKAMHLRKCKAGRRMSMSRIQSPQNAENVLKLVKSEFDMTKKQPPKINIDAVNNEHDDKPTKNDNVEFIQTLQNHDEGKMILKRLVPALRLYGAKTIPSSPLASLSTAKLFAAHAKARVQETLKSYHDKQVRKSQNERKQFDVAPGKAVANVVKEVIRRQTKSKVEPYDKVIFVLDDFDQFDFSSLVVVQNLVEAKLEKFAIVACIHEKKVHQLQQKRNSNYTAKRRKSVDLRHEIKFKMSKYAIEGERLMKPANSNEEDFFERYSDSMNLKNAKQEFDSESTSEELSPKNIRRLNSFSEHQDHRRRKSKILEFYNQWDREQIVSKLLKDITNSKCHLVNIKPFEVREIRSLIYARYRIDEIDNTVLHKIYDLGGSIPGVALDLMEDWIRSGILVWHRNDSSFTKGDAVAAGTKINGSRGLKGHKKKRRLRGCSISNKLKLVWSDCEDEERHTSLPAQVRNHNICQFEGLEYHCQKLLELMSCFPGDVMLKHILLFDLQNSDFFTNVRTIHRTQSFNPNLMRSHFQNTEALSSDRLKKMVSDSELQAEPVYSIDKILSWLERLVDEDILEIEHDSLGTQFRIKRTSMRRAIHDAMLFRTRQSIHKRLVEMFHLYDSDPSAQRFILFHAEKASLYDEVFAFFWNEGVRNHSNKDYEHGIFSFEQALALILDKPKEVDAALHRDGFMLKSLPDHVSNISDIEEEVKKRLAVHYIWQGDFDRSITMIEGILKNKEHEDLRPSRHASIFGCFGKKSKKDNKIHNENRSVQVTSMPPSSDASWENILGMVKGFDRIRFCPNDNPKPLKEISYNGASRSVDHGLSKRLEIVKIAEQIEKWM